MECDICLIEWDSSERIPRLLNCGHTFCQVCLKSILNKCISKGEKFNCPTCHLYQQIETEEDISKLIKNYNLLRIAEKVETRKTMTSRLGSVRKDKDFLLKQEEQKMQKGLYQSRIVSSNFMNNIKFDIEKKCKKHGLPLHSVAEGTNILLCDKCLKESKFSSTPIPGIFNELRKNIDNSQIKACIAKNEIKHLKLFLESYLSEFEKENSKKIEKVFDYFYGVIKYFHNSAKQLLNQCVSQQKAHITENITEMNKLAEELSQIEDELSQIYNLPDNAQLLEKIETIRKVQHKMVNFLNVDWNFDLFSMKVGLNEKEEENFFTAIKNCYHIDVEFLEIDEETPSIRKILKTDSTWQCICEEVSNSLNDITCPSCGLLRKIETYDNNNFQDKVDITSEDIESFIKRRKEEGNQYKILSEKENSNEQIQNIIDAEWFSLWNSYINNENLTENDTELISSPVKEVGYLPPGPITNYKLIDPEKGILKEGLVMNKDYRIINKKIWEYFFLNYNGGPCIEVEYNNNKMKVLSIANTNIVSYTKIQEYYYSNEESEEEEDESNDTIIND